MSDNVKRINLTRLPLLEKLRDTKALHPTVTVFGTRDDINQVFIVVEGQAIQIKEGVVSAVDKMLKIYFVLDMEFPHECKHVLHFLQRGVLQIADDLPVARGLRDLLLFIQFHCCQQK